MIAALNLNDYVQAPVTENVCMTLDPEVRKDVRKTAVIVKALYGIKSVGASFRSSLAICMESLGYESCEADPNLWLKPEIRPEESIVLCG